MGSSVEGGDLIPDVADQDGEGDVGRDSSERGLDAMGFVELAERMKMDAIFVDGATKLLYSEQVGRRLGEDLEM